MGEGRAWTAGPFDRLSPPPYAARPMHAPIHRCARPCSAVLGAVGLLLAGACAGPIQTRSTDDLRRSVIDSTRRELEDAQTRPEPRMTTRDPGEIEFSEERLEELRMMGGFESYEGVTLDLREDLLGYETDLVRISLQDAISRAVRNNLQVQAASVTPAITEQQIVAAEAAFDWVFFASGDVSTTDRPTTVPVVDGIPVGSAINQSRTYAYETGLRKPLTTGGTLSITQGLTVSNNQSPGIEFFPDPSRNATLQFTLDQPLLRDFGTDVNLTEVRLAQNAERDAIQELKATLLDIIAQTEEAYWNLYLSIQDLRIRARLLERGIETREVLRGRLDFDVRPAEFSDAVATVEARRGDVIRAQNNVRLRSDALKALINDPELTVGNELVLAPLDAPIDAPIEFSLLDTVTTALQQRPEIRQAILGIDDASIRQAFAENQELPLLDLALQATYQGLREDADEAYEDVGDGEFIDYLLSLTFQQPIGNRAAEAITRQRRLERLQSVLLYRLQVQNVVLDVKTSLRNVVTNYELIAQSRVSRLAATENLRTLLVEEENTRALTPDFLDLKLGRQEALAAAELEEVRSLVDYNVSLASLYASMGASLDHNQIRFVVPDVGEFEDVDPLGASASR